MAEVWYRISVHSDGIHEIGVERSTDQFVVVGGNRRKKSTDYESYFPTRDEARDELIARRRAHVKHLEAQLEGARQRLRIAEAL